MSSGATVQTDEFTRRVDRLINAWERDYGVPNSAWHNVDALVLITGKNLEETHPNKTLALQLWLFGYEFPETLMVIQRNKKIHIVTGKSKVAVLQPVKAVWDVHSVGSMELLTKTNDDGNGVLFDQILQAIKTAGGSILGVLPSKVEPVGPFPDMWRGRLKPTSVTCQSVVSAVSSLLSTKDDTEIGHCRKAATLAAAIMKDVLINKVEDVVDGGVAMSHMSVAEEGLQCLDRPDMKSRWLRKHKIDLTDADVSFSTVQSKTSGFKLSPNVVNSSVNLSLSPGCVVIAVGTKVEEYCACVGRTLMLNADSVTVSMYSLMVELTGVALKALKPHAKYSEVYNAFRSRAAKTPSLLPHLPKSIGHVTGLEYRDTLHTLSSTCEAAIKPKTVLVLSITISLSMAVANKIFNEKKDNDNNGMSVKTEDNKIDNNNLDNNNNDDTKINNNDNDSKINIKKDIKEGSGDISLWIMDTVLVTDVNTPAQVLTSGVSSTLKGVSYEFQEDEAVEGNEGNENMDVNTKHTSSKNTHTHTHEKKQKAPPPMPQEDIVLERRLRARDRGVLNEEVARDTIAQQKELRVKKIKQIAERFSKGDGLPNASNSKTVRKLSTLSSYHDVSQYPPGCRSNRIFVDETHESCILPVCGTMVPFHASTIKNVSFQQEDPKTHTLRVNFQVPGGSFGRTEDNRLPDTSNMTRPVFIKEMLFRATNATEFNNVFKKIKELIRRVKQKESLEDDKRGLVSQVPLQVMKDKRPTTLANLLVRPPLEGNKRLVGNLEAHTNGFRYFCSKARENIDVLYQNIQHAVFQKVRNQDQIVLLHFHLKNPILVGKKKTSDIQFYREAGSQTHDLHQRTAGRHDPDELAEERRERELKRQLNLDFGAFVKQAEKQGSIEFELPFSQLSFNGVANRSNVDIMPTARCLVHLVEWPPFVLSLEEIEIVSFERVQHGLRAFDIMFVFKDWHKPVKSICSIPTESLDTLKKYFNELELVWYEGKQNLNWTNIMKTILGDAQDFVNNGAFEMFLGDDEQVHDDDEDEDEEDYKESVEGSESSESSGSEASEASSESESHSEVGGGDGDGSDESEALDWDEMEERAARDDRKRHGEERVEEERPKLKSRKL
eukprot:GHVR01109916.1.p1 GENE.GHVR01109916.1~~GHVR01109916.1.p1  ORF type:complete len:1116 (-),score=308.40 GHVR01109916.1:287-3634(-)